MEDIVLKILKTNHQSQLLFALNDNALVSSTDNKENIVFANNHFCKISGFEEEELLGKIIVQDNG